MIIGFHKVGDQQISSVKDKEHHGFRDGDLVDWFHTDWLDGKKLNDSIPKMSRKAYRPVKYNDNMEGFFRELVKPVGIDEDGIIADKTKHVQRGRRISFEDIRVKAGLPLSFITDLDDKDFSSEIIDGTAINDLDFKDSKTIESTKRIDLNLITNGDYTIGVGGAYDYLTFAQFTADFGTPFDGAMTGTLKTAITETAAILFNESMSTYLLSFLTDSYHGGIFTNEDRLITLDHTSFGIQNQHSAGTALFNGLFLRRASGRNNAQIYFSSGTASTKLRNTIIDGQNTTTSIGANVNATTEAFNVIVTRCTSVNWQMNTANTAGSILENIILHGGTSALSGFNFNTDAIVTTLRNCVAFNTSNDFKGSGQDDSTGLNCASGDTTAANGNWSTGTNNITSFTASNEFESTSTASADYLKTKLDGTGQFDDGGIGTGLLADNTTGINSDIVRPSEGNASIGSWQYDFSSSGSIVPYLLNQQIQGAL